MGSKNKDLIVLKKKHNELKAEIEILLTKAKSKN